MLFAAALPVRVGVWALVMPSPVTPVSGENELIFGAAGAVVPAEVEPDVPEVVEPEVVEPDVVVPDVVEPDVVEPDVVELDVLVLEVPEVAEPTTGSTVNDAALTFPATSVAVAVRVCEPADRAEVVTLQAPLELVVAVPTFVVPS